MPGAKARLRLDGADPINRGLAGFWPLNENGGVAVENIAPSPAVGITVNTPTRVFSPAGRVVRFSTAGTQYVNTQQLVGAPSSGTVTWWQNPTYAFNASNLLRVPWGNSTATASGAYLSCQVFSNNQWYVGWVNGTDYRLTFAATAANWPQAWTFYAFTWGPSGNALYINAGQLVASSATVPVVAESTANFALAKLGPAFSLSLSHFAGDLQGVRRFNRALRINEIQRLYADKWAGAAHSQRPIAYTPFPDLSATIDATIPITAQITATLQPFVVDGGDTHDGVKQSRRLRRIEALRQRADAERLADAQALRLSLEAALGLAAEIPTDDAPRVAEAVQRAPKAAEVDWRRVADDAEQYARLSRVVAKLSAVVQAEARRRADADDDDDAAFLLGIA